MIRELLQSYRAKKRFQAAQYKLADRWLREASNLVPDDDEQNWQLLGMGRSSISGKGICSEEYRRQLQDKAYELFRTNEHARSIIRNLEKYIIGPKVSFQPMDDNEKVLNWWHDFETINRFVLKQKEIVRRTFRDGECFIRVFEDRSTGKIHLRFIDAQCICDPSGEISHGIRTEADERLDGDIERVLSYIYCPDGKTSQEIPAEDVIHIKVFADSNEKRGNSIFEVLGASIEGYQKWLRDRMILNRVRSFFGIHKKISNATPSQVAGLASANAVGRKSDSQGRYRQEPMKPGSVITTSDNVDLVPISANLQASDAHHDGRNILLAITAGSGMAEFMVSGDASNSNFASTMVAESPAVREFEDWQEFFAVFFREIFSRVVAAGIRVGEIPERSVQFIVQGEEKIEESRPTSLEVHLQFPPLIHREILQDAQAYDVYLRNGIASRRSISTRAGFDFDAELEHMMREAKTEE